MIEWKQEISKGGEQLGRTKKIKRSLWFFPSNNPYRRENELVSPRVYGEVQRGLTGIKLSFKSNSYEKLAFS